MSVKSLEDELSGIPYTLLNSGESAKKQLLNDSVSSILIVPQSTSLSQSEYASLDKIPTNVLESVQGVSFYAFLKMVNQEKDHWFLNRLRLPGSEKKKAQEVVLALLHGLHAYYAISNNNIPSLLTPLPTRIRYVIKHFNEKDNYVNIVNKFFTQMKRRYLNRAEEETKVDLSIRDLIMNLKEPVNWKKQAFFTAPIGKTPIPIEGARNDTETVKDFYVHQYPDLYSVLGYGSRK